MWTGCYLIYVFNLYARWKAPLVAARSYHLQRRKSRPNRKMPAKFSLHEIECNWIVRLLSTGPLSRRSALGSIAGVCDASPICIDLIPHPFVRRLFSNFLCTRSVCTHSTNREQDSSLLFVSFRVVKIFSFYGVGNLFAHSFLIKHRVDVINGANLRTLSG